MVRRAGEECACLAKFRLGFVLPLNLSLGIGWDSALESCSVAERRYFGLLYRLLGSYRWLLWYSDEVDGLYVDGGRFPSFGSAEALSSYAADRGLPVDTVEATVHDVDAVLEWLSQPARIAVDSAQFLAVWNLAQDAASALGLNLSDRDELADRAYERLFRRSGPGWIQRSEDPDLAADLTPEEKQRLAHVLGGGVALRRLAPFD